MEGDHTCLAGPLCQMADAWLSEPREDSALCEHASCGSLIYEDCRACYIEAMSACEQQMRDYDVTVSFLVRRLCPVDMTEIMYVAEIAAPGYGHSFRCHCHHRWLLARGEWYSEKELRDYVPELTVADVI